MFKTPADQLGGIVNAVKAEATTLNPNNINLHQSPSHNETTQEHINDNAASTLENTEPEESPEETKVSKTSSLAPSTHTEKVEDHGTNPKLVEHEEEEQQELETLKTTLEDLLPEKSQSQKSSIETVKNDKADLIDAFKKLDPTRPETINFAVSLSIKLYIEIATELGAPASLSEVRSSMYAAIGIEHFEYQDDTALSELQQAILNGLQNFDFIFFTDSYISNLELTPSQQKYLELQANYPNDAADDIVTKAVKQTVLEIIIEETKKMIFKVKQGLHLDSINNEIKEKDAIEISKMLQAIRDLYMNIFTLEDECTDSHLIAAINSLMDIKSIVFADRPHEFSEFQFKQYLIMEQCLAALCEVISSKPEKRKYFLAKFESTEHTAIIKWVQSAAFMERGSQTRQNMLKSLLDAVNNSPTTEWAVLLDSVFRQEAKRQCELDQAFRTQAGNVPRGASLFAHQQASNRKTGYGLPDSNNEDNKVVENPNIKKGPIYNFDS